MKNIKIGILLLCIMLVIGCNQKDGEKSSFTDIEVWDSVKVSTNHYDYSHFMYNYPESKFFDTALVRYFKYQEKLYDSIGPPMWDCFNRCISVMVTKNDSVLFEHHPILIENLNKSSLIYLMNENNNEMMPEQKLVKDKNGLERYVTDGFFYLQTDLKSNDKLRQSITEIKLAYKNYKNYLAQNWFKMEFDKLGFEKKELIDNIVTQRIELGKYYEIKIVDEELNNEDILNE